MGTDIEMMLVNKIISAAVMHGGDSGGAYFVNGEQLNDAIMAWLRNRNLTDRYTTDATVYSDYEMPIIGRIPDDGNGFTYLND